MTAYPTTKDAVHPDPGASAPPDLHAGLTKVLTTLKIEPAKIPAGVASIISLTHARGGILRKGTNWTGLGNGLGQLLTGLGANASAIPGGVSAIIGLTHPGLAAEKQLITTMAAVSSNPALLYEEAKQLALVPGASAAIVGQAQSLMTTPPPANPLQIIMMMQQEISTGMG